MNQLTSEEIGLLLSALEGNADLMYDHQTIPLFYKLAEELTKRST